MSYPPNRRNGKRRPRPRGKAYVERWKAMQAESAPVVVVPGSTPRLGPPMQRRAAKGVTP